MIHDEEREERERQQVTSPSAGLEMARETGEREKTGYKPFDRERDNRLLAP